ncbi:hypothetical protein OIU77_029685 [Salix suchowensis]|uniref:Uncharacterized protein n=1 Tax=Salix suchowensis TaxID=1278906 RepID=A0ABQ9BCP9_9ROSI|nr:hypothetical protein OIU77_029685 [Salix suchowensis]
MAEMQLNEIRVDPLTNRLEDPVGNRPEQGSTMAMPEIQGAEHSIHFSPLFGILVAGVIFVSKMVASLVEPDRSFVRGLLFCQVAELLLENKVIWAIEKFDT